MSLDGAASDDLIDELESRGYIVIDNVEYREVLQQINNWKH